MLLVLLASVLITSTQPELVVVAKSTKQFHRPSCPVVRDAKDAKDLLAMNVGQAEARGFRAHAACDPNAAPGASPSAPGRTSTKEGQAPVFVYTADGDTRYHRETCARLPKERKKVLLEEAGKKLWPCSVCRPPIRKRTPALANRPRRD